MHDGNDVGQLFGRHFTKDVSELSILLFFNRHPVLYYALRLKLINWDIIVEFTRTVRRLNGKTLLRLGPLDFHSFSSAAANLITGVRWYKFCVEWN